MQTLRTLTLAAALGGAAAMGATAQDAMENPMVGGAEMMPSMDIIDNAVNSPIHTTLVAAVQAADLVDTLKGEGPFTVFAPTDEAFAALPEGTVDTLLMPENMEMLQGVLTAHVIADNLSAADIMAEVEASSEGYANFTTVSGDALSARMEGGTLYMLDESGNEARVTIADVNQSNGVIHVVDSVLVPEM